MGIMIKPATSLVFGLIAVSHLLGAFDANGIQMASHLLTALLFSLFVVMTMLRSESRGRERSPLAVVASVGATAAAIPIGLAAPATNGVRLIPAAES